MKEITKKQKILMIILAIIIIAGLVITFTLGFNFDLRMQETKKVELYLENSFEIADIKNITNEVFSNQDVIIQKVEVYEDSVSIIAKEITEEQKQSLIDKINEKYGTELTADSTEIVTIPHTRGRDLLKPYVMTFSIATIIILVYIMIRYRKLGIIRTLLKVLFISVMAQATLFSVIAITRIPIGRLTMPMVIIVYLFTLLGITTKLEKQLASKKEEAQK